MLATLKSPLLLSLLDQILPPRCIATGEVVDRQGMISPKFWSELGFIEAPLCNTCGIPFSFPAAEGTVCVSCLDYPPEFDQARSAVVYNEASRKLVLDFKYGDRLNAVHTFAPWLIRAGKDLLDKTDFILPVPLHRQKLWQRRFNQSAIIAQELAKRAGKEWIADALLRLRATVPQKGLSKKERDLNVKNAFGLNARYAETLKGKNVMLIDDVFTSGATLNECARTLRKAGAAAVYILTVARVTKEEF